MVEYIEREAAQKIICGWCGVCKSPTVCDLMHCDDICPQFSQIPAADVRPVVVCADCEYNNHCLTQEFVDDCGKIPLDRNTFFCADGERRSNA